MDDITEGFMKAMNDLPIEYRYPIVLDMINRLVKNIPAYKKEYDAEMQKKEVSANAIWASFIDFIKNEDIPNPNDLDENF